MQGLVGNRYKPVSVSLCLHVYMHAYVSLNVPGCTLLASELMLNSICCVCLKSIYPATQCGLEGLKVSE